MLVVLCCIQLYSYNMIRYVYVCIVFIYIYTHLYFTYTYPVDIPCPSMSSSQVYIGPAMLRALRWFFFIVIDKNRDLCTFRKIEGSNHFIPFLCGKCHVMSAISTKKNAQNLTPPAQPGSVLEVKPPGSHHLWHAHLGCQGVTGLCGRRIPKDAEDG